MKSAIFAMAAAAGTAYAQQSAYGQCGGTNWSGPTDCVSGWTCTSQNPFYYQCTPGTASSTLASSSSCTTTISLTVSARPTITAKASPISTTRASSTSTLVTKVSVKSSSAAPVSTSKATTSSKVATSSKATTSSKAVTTSKATTAAPVTTSKASSSVKASTTSVASSVKAVTSSSKTASSTAAASSNKVKFAGVNISGFDFGCGTDGTCTVSGVDPPGTAGADQMSHFVTDDGLNAFRLPVAWQYLVNDVVGATLDATNLAAYDSLVTSCTSVAEMCIIDIHNYARWNGELIGESGGPTNAQFASLWSQLATKYASNTKVAFGIMNEPHDLTSVTDWAATVQAAVTAIRTAGATSQTILLPGNDWTHASTLISDGSAAALLTVKNVDGTTDNLVFDIHQYLDSDDSGTSSTCVTNNVASLTTLAAWLKTNGRQALLSETGGGSTDSTCLSMVCQELSYLMENPDQFLGYTGWAAGMFATSYVLSLTPSGSAGAYTDQPLLTQCFAGIFNGKTALSTS